MCTAVRYGGAETYFGRTLDYTRSFGETVSVMPRHFPLGFDGGRRGDSHYAVIGMAADLGFSGGYPLFYDGVNEKGLAMAGLNFVESTVYSGPSVKKRTLAVHEVIPYILGNCGSLEEARAAFSEIAVTDTPFRTPDGTVLPSARLHWMLADKTGAVVVESVADGVKVYENPVGVLANEPPFPLQLAALEEAVPSSLPSDFTSPARFVRSALALRNAPLRDGGEDAFFRIMRTVILPEEGVCRIDGGAGKERWYTLYTCCMSCEEGRYFCLPLGGDTLLSAAITDADLDGTVCEGCFSIQ